MRGARHYREDVLARRLERAIDAPLEVARLERALRMLERDPRIERLHARVRPTATRGVARLIVRVDEHRPFWTELGVDNFAPASVGTLAGRLAAGHENPSGRGDRLYVEGQKTEGLWRVVAGYELPIGPFGTTLGFETRQSDADIVQPPFDRVDVESTSQSYAATLRQPVIRGLVHEVAVGLVGEHRRGRTSLLGRDESLSPGTDRGRSRLSLLRPFVDWTVRGRDAALGVRALVTFGLDAPGVTRNGGNTPDGRFIAGLGQLRGIYRDPRSGIEWQARFDLQLADSPLLPLEQFAIGGPDSVRGYPRNVRVGDQGFAFGLEARLPLWIDSTGSRRAELVLVEPAESAERALFRDRIARVTAGTRRAT